MLSLHTTTDLFRLLGDRTRLRLLALLGQEEFTVAELTRITGLTQSRISTHLARLREAGLVLDRPSGSSSFYRLHEGGMSEEVRRLWSILTESTRDPLLEQDSEGAHSVVRSREGGGTWADSVAGQMSRHYSPGRTWEATMRGLLGLLRLRDVLDLASGDGMLAALLAPRARSVTCLDISQKVVQAGARGLSRHANVFYRRGDMHALPFGDGSFDSVLLMNALTYTDRPSIVLREIGRVMRTGGRLVLVTLNRHRHEEAVLMYNHKTLGFGPRELSSLLEEAGLTVEVCEPTSREARPPHFEIITACAHRAK